MRDRSNHVIAGESSLKAHRQILSFQFQASGYYIMLSMKLHGRRNSMKVETGPKKQYNQTRGPEKRSNLLAPPRHGRETDGSRFY